MNENEGTVKLPDAIPSPEDLLTKAADEPDEHRAFHIRSNLPFPSSLCERCRHD